MVNSRPTSLLLAVSITVWLLGLSPGLVTAQQNDAGSGGDAGDTRETATEVEPNVQYSGYIGTGDSWDWYKCSLTTSQYPKVVVSYSWSGTPGNPTIWAPIGFYFLFGLTAPNVVMQPTGSFELGGGQQVTGTIYFMVSRGEVQKGVSGELGAASYSFKIVAPSESQSEQPTDGTSQTPDEDSVLPLVIIVVVLVVIVSIISYALLRKPRVTWEEREIPPIG